MPSLSLIPYVDSIKLNYRSTCPHQAQFHSHNCYEVYYFHSGVGNYVIGDKIYVLAPGDLIIMDGMTLHCAKIDPDVEYVRSVVHFDSAALTGFSDAIHALNILQPFEELKNYRICFRGQDKKELELILARMNVLTAEKDPISYNRFRLAFVDLLYVIFKFCQDPLLAPVEFSSMKEQTTQQVISYLDKHYNEDIHLDQLQNELHNSKYYLSKVFKEVTGITIFDFLYQRRINQAKILFLFHKELSVTEISYEVGFKQPAHFSRIFKRQVGISPEQFRRSQVK